MRKFKVQPKNRVEATTKITASENEYVSYRIYEVEDGEELDCVEVKYDLDDAIEYARKYAKDNLCDTHVVASPNDEDDPEVHEYFEYELGIEPYEVVWQSY